MRKRLLLILIVLSQLLGSFALAASADTEYNVYTINGVEIAADDYTSSPGNCRAYAEKFYRDIWGTGFSNNFYDDDNLLRNLETEEVMLTEEFLKSCVQQAAIGSVIRASSLTYLHRNDGPLGHTQLIVQKDENGFTVLEGGMAEPPHFQEHYYTWHEYVTAHWLGAKYHYLKYIYWPGAPEYTENYDIDGPEVSELTVAAASDGESFTASFAISDESDLKAAWLQVRPQGADADAAQKFPCLLSGNSAVAMVNVGSFNTEGKNFLCEWYAMDANGNVGGGEMMPELVSLYVPLTRVHAICQISADGTQVRSAPVAAVNGEDTLEYEAAGGELYFVTGIYHDAEGVQWYSLSDGHWVKAQDMKYNTLASFVDWLAADYEEKYCEIVDGQLMFFGA